jgi:hypothetical protein
LYLAGLISKRLVIANEAEAPIWRVEASTV